MWENRSRYGNFWPICRTEMGASVSKAPSRRTRTSWGESSWSCVQVLWPWPPHRSSCRAIPMGQNCDMLDGKNPPKTPKTWAKKSPNVGFPSPWLPKIVGCDHRSCTPFRSRRHQQCFACRFLTRSWPKRIQIDRLWTACHLLHLQVCQDAQQAGCEVFLEMAGGWKQTTWRHPQKNTHHLGYVG